MSKPEASWSEYYLQEETRGGSIVVMVQNTMGIWGDVVQKVNGDVRGWREMDVASCYSCSTVVEIIIVGEGEGAAVTVLRGVDERLISSGKCKRQAYKRVTIGDEGCPWRTPRSSNHSELGMFICRSLRRFEKVKEHDRKRLQ